MAGRGKFGTERTFEKLTGGEEHIGVLGNALEHRLLLWPRWVRCTDVLFNMETVSYMAKVLQLELEELISNSTSKADLLLDPHEPACHCASG